mmetsp:Transcript_25670/g.48916  ORF Transcript_25670/g.48916 Transcript_25670/m.48916 type:complete len:234 (-) Transcript_25670:536-1237(-)|eukprot:CAMPEP_0201681808 /NCGR_PEP_ID=MMETSP0494-20130426/51301_1 /ASSEMBLY_ACC=CAM_ASM_000839 /TAXON_ID=420259 /ORGANISM="Thalassiosira gravida, Strain GMp14c1" /LENGTH=233 /DNA_ID=CAMNT_0048165561 /DNA_START=56 /DNA_END=757 /DNA_ORIENTATION=+
MNSSRITTQTPHNNSNTEQHLKIETIIATLLLHSTTTAESSLAGSVLAITSTERRLALSTELVLITVTSLGASGRFLVCGRHNLRRKAKVSSEVLDALLGEVAVVVLPAEGATDESTGEEGLHEVENLEVGASLDVGVGGADGVLLDDEDSLTEEVREDSDAVGFGDEHGVRVLEKWLGECPGCLDRIFKLKHEKLKKYGLKASAAEAAGVDGGGGGWWLVVLDHGWTEEGDD